MDIQREIGQWIFTLDDCPREATAAVVNRDRTFAWWCGTHPEKIKANLNLGSWSAFSPAAGSWQLGGARYIALGDWSNSLVIKEKLKNEPFVGVIIMPME